jgi:CHAT domain-containing protein
VDALALVALGRIEGARADPLAAAQLVDAGAELLAGMRARDLLWEALAVRGALLERGGDLAGAAAAYAQAIEILEEVRSSIGPPLLRSRYSPKTQGVYEALVGVEARWPAARTAAERARATFEIAERSRARTFAEMLAAGDGAPAGRVSPERRDPRELRARIHALRTRLTELRPGAAEREALERELRLAERACTVERQGIAASLSGETRRGSLDVDRALRTTAEGAAVLAYLLGDATSYGWHADRDGLTLFELPARAEIENLVLIYRGLLAHGDRAAARRLGELLAERLLGPVARQLEGERALVVVPDGALFHLPFETLPGPGGADLVERYAVHYAPSLRVLESLRQRVRERRDAEAAVVAFGVSSADAQRPALAHAGREALRVASLVPRRWRRERVGAAATESEFHRLAAQPSRVLHVATHGVFDDLRPERSGLLFATEPARPQDGFLDLHEVAESSIATDLVVLSGCETARGELLRGEGVLGLSRAFLSAGSRAVVASLWRVDDRATEELMLAFYRGLAAGKTAAAALREAKLAQAATAPSRGEDAFAWAAFVLVGDGTVRIDWPAPLRVALGRGLLAAGLAVCTLSFAVLGRRRLGRGAA